MSQASLSMAAVLFVTVPLVAWGGISLLMFLARRMPGYLDNPMRQNLYRAGHAHAGVLVILALVAMLYVDRADLSDGVKSLVRTAMILPPILMPLGFFLSVLRPTDEKPNKLIWLVPAGGLALVVGTLILGIGLFRA